MKNLTLEEKLNMVLKQSILELNPSRVSMSVTECARHLGIAYDNLKEQLKALIPNNSRLLSYNEKSDTIIQLLEQ
jgi:hypothetical protein